jgi:predicted nucleic acid-binding protein
VSGSYLLDTNIVIAFFSGEPAVIDQFDQADEILLPSSLAGQRKTWRGLKTSARKSTS